MLINKKYKYKNKMRYDFRKKKQENLLWKKNELKFDINANFNSFIKNKAWKKNTILKKKDNRIDRLLYIAASKRFNILKNINDKKKKEKNWNYNIEPILKKKLFITDIDNRENLMKNIINSLQENRNNFFIKNSLYLLYENNTGLYKELNILNFSWLLDKSKLNIHLERMERFTWIALKTIYNGFIFKGLKRQCEIKITELLIKLKIYLKNKNLSGFQIFFYFIQKVKPLLGFRRKRISRNNAKGKDLRFLYKLYYHNWRWQGLLIKRFIFNSPFYLKKTKKVTVNDIYKGLIYALESKGPIMKGLISYYKLINKRTPFAKRKKKKGKRGKL